MARLPSIYNEKTMSKFELFLPCFHIFHPNPDPTSKVRQNLVAYAVVLA